MPALTLHEPFTSHLVHNQNHISSSFSSSSSSTSPSSRSSPVLDSLATASSSTSSLDQFHVPSAEHDSTLIPWEDHADMISHHTEFVPLDDEENYDSHGYGQEEEPPAFSDADSQPTSPSLPATVIPDRATVMTSSPSRASGRYNTRGALLTMSVPMQDQSLESSRERRSATCSSSSPPYFSPSTSGTTITSFFTAPPPLNPSNSRLDHHSMPSPFSFFANSTTPATTMQDESNTTGHGSHSRASVKTLRIELTHSEIVLVAGKPTVLEGVLYVTLNKSTKVKSLQLEFTGRSSVTWVDDNAYSPATRHTTAPHIEHTWHLITHPHKKGATTVLPAGQHAYPFSFELPDTLPESLTTSHGKVVYRLLATMTKPGITFSSYSATAFVPVLRRHTATSPASRTYHRGARIISSLEDKVQYKISLPQVRVPHSTKIPLQVSITSPHSRIAVSVLQVGLWERAVYRADGRKRVDMRLVKIQKSEGWTLEDREAITTEAVTWNKVLLFDMPPMGAEINQCNPSADNGLMKVTHTLRFSILGTDGNKRFRVENEIDLKVLALEDEYPPETDQQDEDGEQGDPMNELPSYLTSFTTPRVSFDSEREMDSADDDLLRALIARIHLPTYAESEEDTNSRDPSRDVSRNVSQAPSRCASPERSLSNGSSHSHSSNGDGNNGNGSSAYLIEEYVSLPTLPLSVHHPRLSPSYQIRASTPLRSAA